jgi:flagellar operon protein
MTVQQIRNRIDPNNTPQKQRKSSSVPGRADGSSFTEILQQHKLEFSGHAMKRLKNRSISMDKQDMKRLEEAVVRAEEKGGKDSLVMDGNRAFLVNIPNKKVITAVDMMELRDKVFTNIDSTVLTKRI